MINITLPDGSVRSYENSLTAMDVAKDISEGFARNVTFFHKIVKKIQRVLSEIPELSQNFTKKIES